MTWPLIKLAGQMLRDNTGGGGEMRVWGMQEEGGGGAGWVGWADTIEGRGGGEGVDESSRANAAHEYRKGGA
jgi:hypothetical protein